MRLLVTGASGQIGRALATRLQPHGTVVAVGRSALDLTKPDEIPAALDRLAPDILINAAAYTAVDKAEEEPALAMRVNGVAPGVLARWAAARAVPFIHFSTDYVFDGSGDQPWREDDPVHPLSGYGASKRAGENLICAAGGCFLILRISWVYSAQGTNFLRTIARLARDRKELRIVADQFGAPSSAALIAGAVGDMVAQGVVSLRERCARANGLVHVAASGETSWHGFASAIIAGLQTRMVPLAVERVIPIHADEYPARANRPRNSRLDTARLREVFGITLPPWPAPLEAELDLVARELRLVPDPSI